MGRRGKWLGRVEGGEGEGARMGRRGQNSVETYFKNVIG